MPYGYFWRYVKDYDPEEDFLSISNRVKQNKIGKKLCQHDKNHNLIKIWNSITEACNALYMNKSMISYSTKNNRPYKNHYWTLKEQ